MCCSYSVNVYISNNATLMMATYKTYVHPRFVTILAFLVNNNLVTVTNIIAVQLFVRIFHFLRSLMIAKILIDVEQSHLSCSNIGQPLQSRFQINNSPKNVYCLFFKETARWYIFRKGILIFRRSINRMVLTNYKFFLFHCSLTQRSDISCRSE